MIHCIFAGESHTFRVSPDAPEYELSSSVSAGRHKLNCEEVSIAAIKLVDQTIVVAGDIITEDMGGSIVSLFIVLSLFALFLPLHSTGTPGKLRCVF